MADQFYKAMKRNETSSDNKEKQNLAIKLMMNYVSEANETEFFDKLLSHMDMTFKNQKNQFPEVFSRDRKETSPLTRMLLSFSRKPQPTLKVENSNLNVDKSAVRSSKGHTLSSDALLKPTKSLEVEQNEP